LKKKPGAVAVEFVADLLGKRLDKFEVVLRRLDGTVTHIGREGRKSALDVNSGPIPTNERLHSKCKAKVVDTWNSAFAGADTSFPENPPY